MTPIHLRNIPPPNETFNHTTLISFLASYMKPRRYLELGVRSGRTIVEVAKFCEECIGVDISTPQFIVPSKISYHQMTTDAYFDNLNPDITFDMVFIDADHSHAQSLKDFNNVRDRVIEDGMIVFHDTYPYHPSMFSSELCHDVYKTAHYIKLHLANEFESITLPFNPGVTLVKKIASSKQLIYL